MISADYCRLMARYNTWQNGSLVAAADGLTNEDRWKDRGAFFQSIAATLNHLYWADALMLERLKGKGIIYLPSTRTQWRLRLSSRLPEKKMRQAIVLELFRQAAGLGRRYEQQVPRIEGELVSIQAKLEEVEADLQLANSAMKRTASFQADVEGTLQCPDCWVVHGVHSSMEPRPSDGGKEDLFTCPKCHHSVLA